MPMQLFGNATKHGTLLAVALSLLISVAQACAQNPTPAAAPRAVPTASPTVGPNGQPVVPGQTPGTNPAQVPGQAPGATPQPGAATNGQPKGPEPKVIRRDQADKGSADSDELEARVGDDGKVSFNFRDQPWVDLLEWLAEISQQPLDWQELPGDTVNMRSPGRYTVEETQDLFNRHLLSRGYTLLRNESGLTVAKTTGIDPAIVPRVDPAALRSLPPHSFVRTLVDTGWLPATKLTEELKPMISSNGRLAALTTTNRIEAMDAVVNLRQIVDLLAQESSDESRRALAPEFQLRFLPAEQAKLMLEQFLGIEQKKSSQVMTPQQMQMMQQQMRQNPGQAMQQPKKEAEISVVANFRQNSIIIRAPADRVAIAMEFLKRVDVPSDAMSTLADIKTRVQVFRLATLDPEKLLEIVGEMNVLEPTTRVSVDKENDALIVSGSAADRFIIGSLIQRLDGSGRSFEVLPLRRLDPIEVAESINFLMAQEDEEDNDPFRPRFYSFSSFGRNDDDKKKKDEFRVAANTRYRQVLLWANEQEMAEVRSLLIKLGELPPPGGSRRTVRTIDAMATPETFEYLQRLRTQWNQTSPNQLDLPAASEFREPNQSPDRADSRDESGSDGDADSDDGDIIKKPPAKEKPDVSEDTVAGRVEAFEQVLTMQQPGPLSDEFPDGSSIRSSDDFDRRFGNRSPEVRRPIPVSDAPAAIQIEVDRSGNLVIRSDDTEALDRLENLMIQFAPPRRPYHVFHIEHATAAWMRINLEDYFDNSEDDSSDDAFFQWYFGGRVTAPSDDDKGQGLGSGAKLRFIDDPDTNTVVVTGATPSQLRTISELIALWDVPEPVNKRKMRFIRLVPVEYGRAENIAETLKEAYRDLLSSNDKAFSNAGGQRQDGQQKQQANKSRFGFGMGLQDSESGRDGGGADFSFKGKLSLGVDPVGNTLLVSAEGQPLLELVTDMIGQLDEAARPSGEVRVFEIPGGITGQSLEAALQSMGARTTRSAGDQPRTTTPQQTPQQPQGNPGSSAGQRRE